MSKSLGNGIDPIEVVEKYGADSLRYVVATNGTPGQDNNVGFIFDAMAKEDLFKTVILDGALPRKTFSMGHANDKRYYLEARKIK